MEQRPVRVYLDQKDFSRIGKGLQGKPECAPDLSAYHELLSLVESEKARIYFSVIHLIEALRYDDEKADLLIPYCEAVDTLTRGHCLRFPTTIPHEEVKQWVRQQIDEGHAESDFSPFGRYVDALPSVFLESFLENFDLLSRLRADLARKSVEMPPPQRQMMLRASRDDNLLKQMFMGLPQVQIDQMVSCLPFEFESRHALIEFVFGDLETQKRVLEKVFGSFNRLIPLSREFPDFKDLGFMLDGPADTAGKHITSLRETSGPEGMDPESVSDQLTFRFLNDLQPTIEDFCADKGLEASPFLRQLEESQFRDIPSVGMLINGAKEYFRLHRAPVERGRRPKQSDIADLNHARFLPYMDIFCCDGFFAQVLRGCNVGKTRVITRLTEVPKAIEKQYKTLSRA